MKASFLDLVLTLHGAEKFCSFVLCSREAEFDCRNFERFTWNWEFMEGMGDKELRAPSSWIPATPAKPMLPRPGPICVETRETEANGEDSSESDEFPPGFAPFRRTDGVVPSSSSGRGGGAEMKGALDDLAAAGFYGQDETARRWQNLSVSAGIAVESGHFQGLLALVDAAAMGGPPDERPTNSFVSFSDPHGDSPRPSPNPSADVRVAEPDPPHRPWLDGSHWPSYPGEFGPIFFGTCIASFSTALKLTRHDMTCRRYIYHRIMRIHVRIRIHVYLRARESFAHVARQHVRVF